MYLTVNCTEVLPRATMEDTERLARGTFLGVTSLDDARGVAAALPHAQSVVVLGGGHTVGGTPCIDGVIARFIEKPFAPVDVSCIRPIATPFAKAFPP